MTTGTGRARAAVALLLWLALLAGIVVGLHGLGGRLAPPPLTDPGRLNGWLEERQPAEAAFALLRLVGLGTAWYLLGATVLGALVRVARARAAIRVADLFTVPAVRRLASAAAGATVAAALSTGTGTSGAGGHGPSHGEIDMITLLGQEAPITSAEPSEGDADGGNPAEPPAEDAGQDAPPLPTLRRLPEGPGASPPLPARPPAQPATAPAAPSPAPADRRAIRPGQHFWSLAEDVLASAWQRAPSDDEVDPYWRRLVAANRSILRDPDNPDLLYPGQVITVPPPPAAPPVVKNPNVEARPSP